MSVWDVRCLECEWKTCFGGLVRACSGVPRGVRWNIGARLPRRSQGQYRHRPSWNTGARLPWRSQISKLDSGSLLEEFFEGFFGYVFVCRLFSKMRVVFFALENVWEACAVIFFGLSLLGLFRRRVWNVCLGCSLFRM